MKRRQYFETNLFHTFQNRPLSISTARTAAYMMNQNGNAKNNGCIQYPVCLQLEQATRCECIIGDHFAACLAITEKLKRSSPVLCVKLSFMIFHCPLFCAFFWRK